MFIVSTVECVKSHAVFAHPSKCIEVNIVYAIHIYHYPRALALCVTVCFTTTTQS